MLRTAILDRLCAPLCESVTGASSGRELLGSIEKRQLLLAPLDDVGQWYRYHALLADYLKQRLQSEMALEIPGLHQRAALLIVHEITNGPFSPDGTVYATFAPAEGDPAAAAFQAELVKRAAAFGDKRP